MKCPICKGTNTHKMSVQEHQYVMRDYWCNECSWDFSKVMSEVE